MAKPITHRSIAQNRKARHEFLILEELECGIALVGTEVKSLRAGRCSLAEAYAAVKRNELWLCGMHISEYSHGNKQNHQPVHDRKLLAKRREIDGWFKKAREKGITMIPLEVYFEGSLIKVRLGLCRGKKLYDKRQASREKDDKRETDRELKRGR